MNSKETDVKWLGIIVALQVLILLSIWGAGPSVSIVRADGIPDAGAQQDQLIQQQKATNDKLDKLIALLASGDLKVKVTKVDDGSGK
jgi:hypothetical protein